MSNRNKTENTYFKLEGFIPYQLAVVAESVSKAFSKTYAKRFGITKGSTDRVNKILEPGILKRTRIIDINKPKIKLEITTKINKSIVFKSKSKTFQDLKKLR